MDKTITNEDLVVFMKAMITANETLAATLSKEIKSGREVIERELTNITKNIEELQEKNTANKKKVEDRFNKLEGRITNIEKSRPTTMYADSLKRKIIEGKNVEIPADRMNCQKSQVRQDQRDSEIERQVKEAKEEEEKMNRDRRNQEKAAELNAA